MNEFVCCSIGDRPLLDTLIKTAEKRLSAEPDLLDNLKICLKELLANIREHSYHLNPRRNVYLQLIINPDKVIAIIIHGGDGWRDNGFVYYSNPQQKMEELLLDGQERGRGQLMIYMCSDRFQYKDDGRVCILTWNRGVQCV